MLLKDYIENIQKEYDENLLALIKEAFEDGYYSKITYNDLDVSCKENEWDEVVEYYKGRITKGVNVS